MVGAPGNPSVPLRSLVSASGLGSGEHGVRVRGRGEGDAEISYFGDEWVAVDGVLPSIASEDTHEELGAYMCEDVRKGQNTCCFTYGEPECGQAELMLSLMQATTKDLLKSVEDANRQGGVAASLQVSLFELSVDEQVKDHLNPTGGEIGSYSLLQDPLRGPVVPNVRSLQLTSVADFDAQLPQAFFMRLGETVDLTAAHVVYQATLYWARERAASPKTRQGVSHQVSNMRIFLLSQNRAAGGEIFAPLLEIVDGLADAADDAKIRHLRSLVRARALTYLMSESLGGNCATTAVGCLGSNSQSARNILKFAARARRVRGNVGQNLSDHITVVHEIRKQLDEAEGRARRRGEDGAPPSQGTDWESDIAIKREAICLLEDLAAKVHTSGYPERAETQPLDDALDVYLTSPRAAAPDTARRAGAAQPNGAPEAAARPRPKRSPASDPAAAKVRLALDNKALRERVGEYEGLLEEERAARLAAGEKLRDATRRVAKLEAEKKREQEEADAVRKLEKARERERRLEKRVEQLEAERDISVSMQRAAEERAVKEREALRTEHEARQHDMQALLQQKQQELEEENAALRDGQRDMQAMLVEGRRQYAMLLRQLRQRQEWRPPGRYGSEVPPAQPAPRKAAKPTRACRPSVSVFSGPLDVLPPSPRDAFSREHTVETQRNSASSDAGSAGRAAKQRGRRIHGWHSKVVARQKLVAEKLRTQRDDSTPSFHPQTNKRTRVTGRPAVEERGSRSHSSPGNYLAFAQPQPVTESSPVLVPPNPASARAASSSLLHAATSRSSVRSPPAPTHRDPLCRKLALEGGTPPHGSPAPPVPPAATPQPGKPMAGGAGGVRKGA
eukprot:TRINITY_DN14311_c0_g1_i2.p1 TRINITY_DN14311_c0_g1~~TRINITY_DN14311_c0_g1_i2.p1  ORF type:complete len:847 (+),score=219.73 TRINITY_DN14311_c0_g1_i2:70-2610(+)